VTDSAAPPRPGPIRGLRIGLAGWLAFGVALVAIRGVRWDENYEFAQALIGTVKYPAWHPLVYWVQHLFTGQLYLMALMMKVFPEPLAANAARNVFFVWATVVPPYLFGAAFSRTALAGHMAAVLMLVGVTLDFDASYPQFVLPGMFSSGHVGTGFVLVAVAALALGRPAIAFFFFGLAPAVHIGQTPLLAVFIGFLLLARRLHPQPKGAWRRADFALLAGLGASAAILAGGYFAWRDASLPAPFAASAHDIHTIWAGWVGYHDMHRQPPGILAVILTAAFVLLAYLTMFGLGFAKDRARFAWPIVVVYISAALLIVLSIMLVQKLLGARIPEPLLTWLPYRLWNHLPPVFVAGIVALLIPRRDAETGEATTAPTICLIGALAFLAMQPALQALAPEAFALRYLSSSAPTLFFAVGAIFSLLILSLGAGRERFRAVAALSAIALLFLTALVHQFGALCAAAGAMTALLALRIPVAPNLVRFRGSPCLALLTLILAQFVIAEYRNRQQLPIGDFETQVASYLQSRGESDALLASPMGQVLLQAQTGHPVLEDLATPFYIGYRPLMGPQINAMYREVYGMDFRLPSPGRPWQLVWMERSAEEWRSLGARYEFRYVVAPEGVVLRLDEAIEVAGRRLYRVDLAS